MKDVLLYNKLWRIAWDENFKTRLKKLNVEAKTYDEVQITPHLLKEILKFTNEGFDELVRRGCIPSIQDMTYSECLKWICEQPNFRLLSCMLITFNNDMTIDRVFFHWPDVNNYLNCLEKYK